MSRRNTVYPQLDLGRWAPGNRWELTISVDHGGNITGAAAAHIGPGPRASTVDDWNVASIDVRPFDDLLDQLRNLCIEAAAAGVQLRLPGMSHRNG